ncbi:sulfite exporter TauE/SafE family protein [Ideonella sp. BN130291]|uniref:sulfite exporter TauE/SafE family protein n=1 Tax=Ideonella sp. BN130291 TaxID=3112940 RepID=UPI002E273A91|nr:sulfite exporter TauE/SafE family protein [Ideonella sp. BN130291]
MNGPALLAAAALMGLAGSPHCAAMCSAPCAAVLRGCGASRSAPPAFHLGRVAGYALAGAVAASSMAALRSLAELAPLLRPLWTLLHAGALALGVWMLVTGRLPTWRSGASAALAPAAAGASPGWHRIAGPGRAAAAGSSWILWPCGLSQAALLLAALADSPWLGAATMGSFALASAPALVLLPLALRRLAGPGGRAPSAWPARSAGAMVAAASGWALTHGLWERVAAWCAT